MSEIKVNSVVNSTGDNDSGLDLSTNDQVIIKTANTTAVTVDSSQDTTVAGNIKKTGDLTIDVSGDITLDADGGDVNFKDGGTQYGFVAKSSDNCLIGNSISDGDVLIRGNDGGSNITALEFDMSDAGTAIFNNKVLIGTSGSMNLGFGTQKLSVLTTDGTSPQILGATNATTTSSIIYNSSASAGMNLCDWRADRVASTSYNFLVIQSDNNNDVEFNFRGDGNAFADGSFSGGGADYAEYFEWADGNTDDEDRRGFTVVLDGNKIRKSTSEDNASSVIGVVSAMPAMIGDSGQLRWQGKYERDEWGSYILEEYTQTQWTDADGELKSYQTDKIPSDVTVPSDAVVTSTEEDGKTKLMRRKQNSSYDASQTYIPREDRKEWDTIGLMGKLKVRVGQTVGDRWIKMKEISDTVHEYLVR